MNIACTFVLVSSFLVSFSNNQEYTNIEGRQCNGTVSGTLVYRDGEVVRVEFNGRDPVSSTIIAQFRFSNLATLTDQERYAGENGITVEDDGHNILLFPGGYSGQQVVYLFNYTSKSTNAINVYCQPVSLAYRPDQRLVVGHCTINTTIMRVPYFALGVRNGKWMDISPTGLYSNQLDAINLTNAIILQYENDYDAFATKLYFADSSTLHEIDLGNLRVDTYPLPNGNQIYRLVPAGNSPFPVLRVIFYNGNNSGYSHHYFSSSESRFINLIFHTDFVAYDSFDLSYFVTFVNHNTLTIIRQDKTSKQFPLNITLDDPIQCENMVMGPNVHYLICLADGGLHPVIINIIEPVTSEVIPVFNSQIVQIRMLTKDTFYLLTAKREMLFYVVNSAVVYLGRYALRRGIDYVVTNSTSDIVCSNATSKPDDMNINRDGPHLGIIIYISIVVLLLLLLPLGVLVIYRAVIYIVKRRGSPSEQKAPTASKHVDDKETTQGDGDKVESTCDDHDRDETTPVDDSSTNVLESVHSSRHSVSTCSFIIERDPSAENANNERLFQNNTEEAVNDSEIKPNPYVMPFESSAKCDDNIEMQVFEHRSNQPVPFVEAKCVIMPVSTTKENQSSPAPDVERTDS